jgi:hypothetical protein
VQCFQSFSFFSSILDSNIFLVIFSNTLSVYSSVHIEDQVSYPYKTSGKIVFLYLLIFMVLDFKKKTEHYALDVSKHSWFQSAFNLIF